MPEPLQDDAESLEFSLLRQMEEICRAEKRSDLGGVDRDEVMAVVSERIIIVFKCTKTRGLKCDRLLTAAASSSSSWPSDVIRNRFSSSPQKLSSFPLSLMPLLSRPQFATKADFKIFGQGGRGTNDRFRLFTT